jgi:choline dehydrogenase-like flavoprotein
MTGPFDHTFEYIVVGSGAGGGTVAARLAEAGRRVLLLEAGGDPRDSAGGDPIAPASPRLPDDYDVPAFHAFASENDGLSWSFFVQHHADRSLDHRDANYRSQLGERIVDGIFYPRSGALGGCTAHNAMIFVYPHNADWDHIAGMTGDPSWSAQSMRRYFERLENCHHRPVLRWLARLGINPARHGWNGWLPTEIAVPLEALTDRKLRRVVLDSAAEAFVEGRSRFERLRWFLRGLFDPNDWRLVRENAFGIRYLPLTTRRHARYGTRERVLDVARRHPDNLAIRLNTLVTRVLVDESGRASGVEALEGARLYRAHVRPSTSAGEPRTFRASREVILAGGAFNTPQLLMLSGIGPPEDLSRLGLPSRVALPGVGRNLQDRYEISVVSRMGFPAWDIYDGVTFGTDDAAYREWRRRRTGLYATNGAVLAVFSRSREAGGLPDLFCMALLAGFDGYRPGYSADFGRERNMLSWVVLKAHTKNASGRVTLRSADPRDMPVINFNQFSDGADEDVRALVEGMRFVRLLNDKVNEHGIRSTECIPGRHVGTDAELERFVREHAWGHHACGTCAIGPPDRNGVVDSRFRVHGVRGLRVVDASIFPRIPGFFIASSVYLIAEKAADVLLADE